MFEADLSLVPGSRTASGGSAWEASATIAGPDVLRQVAARRQPRARAGPRRRRRFRSAAHHPRSRAPQPLGGLLSAGLGRSHDVRRREKLSPTAYKALGEDQSRWVKSYTGACGVPINGPVPSLPVMPSMMECFKRASRARTDHLATRLSELQSVASESPRPTTQLNDAVNDALVRAGIPRPVVEAMAAWDDCTERAADRFADQPETARTVAEAAMGACTAEETKLIAANGIRDPASLQDAAMPRLLARVMAIRAARAKFQRESPNSSPNDKLQPDVNWYVV